MARLLAVLLVFCFSGCADLLAPEHETPPNLSVVRAGATRAQIESELGRPIKDIRAMIGSGADRKATYRYFLRDKTSGVLSFSDAMVDSMVGVSGREIVVYYSRDQKAVRVEQTITHKK